MFLTIRSEYESAHAISMVRLPSARRRSTATSRWVRRRVADADAAAQAAAKDRVACVDPDAWTWRRATHSAPNRVQPECPVGRTNGPTELPFRETRDVLDEPVADPLGDRVRAIPRAQAVLDLGDDRLDGALGVAESVRDLLRIGAAREHSQHFE